MNDLYLDYAVRWRGGDARPGRQAARQTGLGGNFRGLRPFWQLQDARHIDVRRSIMDPFDTLMVRQMENTGSIALVVAADLSASMPAAPGCSNFALLAAVVEAASRSAQRAGDAFGFIGFDETVREDFYLPPTRGRGAGAELVRRLAAARPGRGAAGIGDLTRYLPEKRCLVLLISDFLMPLPLLENALGELARHDVAPVVTHAMRRAALPRHGLLRLRDAETGRTRLVLMRRSVHETWRRAQAEWRTTLDRVFARHCRPAFHISGDLHMAALGEWLAGG